MTVALALVEHSGTRMIKTIDWSNCTSHEAAALQRHQD